MRQILLALCVLITFNVTAQEKEKGKFFKDVYKELFKYSTIYVAGDMKNSFEEPVKDIFLDIPVSIILLK
jgi:hypothetical protein